jgi:hypothetical protein
VADRRGVDIISNGRDPDRHTPGASRWIIGAVALALIGGVAIHLILGGAGRPAHRKAQRSLLTVTVAAPAMLRGIPLRPGAAPAGLLFLGGNTLRTLAVRERAPARPARMLPEVAAAGDPLGPAPVVRQIISVAGGVIVVLAGDGSAGLPDIGNVLFIPAGASGAGTARVIARANYVALAPNHRDVWVEQAGAPWGNGPASSPAWLVDEAGHRLSAVAHLHGQVLEAATIRGLLVQGRYDQVKLINPASGAAVHTGIPANVVIAGADASHVAWQAVSCMIGCVLHVTSLQDGADTKIALPLGTALDQQDTSAFDPAGQRFALPLDAIGDHALPVGTYVYVADLSDRTVTRAPGGPIPLATLPAVPGAIPSGNTDVVSVHWTAADSGLWIVATDGLFFQAAYWTGAGPLRALPSQPGLAYKFDIPGPAAPG